jgi:TPR repeat protein
MAGRSAQLLAAVLLVSVAATAGWWLMPNRQPLLAAAEIDRLRMAADAGQAQALLRLREQAGQGNLEAQRAAAAVLLGSAAPAAIADGMRLARRAAERGDRGAQYLLARALFDGSAPPPDRPQARLWFERAAHQQHPQAGYMLGLMFQNGYGGAADHRIAADWFARSAALGNPDAMFMLATALLAGDGVPTDPVRALALLRAAAELEQPLAAQMLAYGLRDGTLGLARDAQASAQMMVEVEHALHHPRTVW